MRVARTKRPVGWAKLAAALCSVLAGLPASALAATPPVAAPSDAGAEEPRLDCLPQRTGDLASFLRAQRFAGTHNAQPGAGNMTTITRGSPRWMSGFNAVLAWQNDDCPAFSAFAEHMGYDAVELRDARSGSRHWVLTEKKGPFNGLFVLRAPTERDAARPLVLVAPHRSTPQDVDPAVQVYLASGASALLVNSAHPCNLQSCGGCIMEQSALCGGCTRSSDAAASVDNLLFGLYSALVATRRDVRVELDALAGSVPLPAGCRGLALLSQGPALPKTATQAAPVVAEVLWRGLTERLGPACACWDERQPGCAKARPRVDTLYGRMGNEEPLRPFDPCGQQATQRSGRYLHIATRGVSPALLGAALSKAVPSPAPPASSK